MNNSEKYVDDRSGFIFFCMTYWVFDSMFGAMLAFPSEKLIVDKERGSGSYQVSAYFMAKTISEAPCRLIMPIIYISIAYWMAGMRPSAAAFFGYKAPMIFMQNALLPLSTTSFGRFTVTELLAVLVGESIGLLIGATVPNFEHAITVMTLVSLALMLTGGKPNMFASSTFFRLTGFAQGSGAQGLFALCSSCPLDLNALGHLL